MLTIILARDASAAWLELLPELRVSFRDDAEVDAFVERAVQRGLLVKAEGTDVVGRAPESIREAQERRAPLICWRCGHVIHELLDGEACPNCKLVLA